MKTTNILKTAAIATWLCFAATAYSQMCGGMKASAQKDKSKNEPTENQKSSNNTTAKTDTALYTCPMHPEVQSNKPGNCPKCGMALVKKSDAKGMKMMCPMMGGMDDKNKTGSNEQKDSTKQGKTDTKAPVQNGISYTCSMHPDVKSDKPGKCLKCGMDLIEKK